MVQLSTFPTQEVLEQISATTPDYMRPNNIPFAAVAEGYLMPSECDQIIEQCMQMDEYVSKDCGAITREIVDAPSLGVVRAFTWQMNALFWNYDLDLESRTWLQTYRDGGKYQLHMDSAPGQMRKLTAVALLSDPETYTGGDLVIHFHPANKIIPKTRGTIVVFQPWLLHEVTPVTNGTRQTVNMGFWGPNFR